MKEMKAETYTVVVVVVVVVVVDVVEWEKGQHEGRRPVRERFE